MTTVVCPSSSGFPWRGARATPTPSTGTGSVPCAVFHPLRPFLFCLIQIPTASTPIIANAASPPTAPPTIAPMSGGLSCEVFAFATLVAEDIDDAPVGDVALGELLDTQRAAPALW